MRSKTNISDVLELAELLRPSWPEINARIDASRAPTCRVAEGSPEAKLKAIEGDLRDLREERAVLLRERDKARAAWSQSPDRDPASAVFKRAAHAVEELADADKRIDDLRTAQEGTLRMLGGGSGHARRGRDGNGPTNDDSGAGNGWQFAAAQFDLEHGRDRVTLPLSELLPLSPRAVIGGVTVSPSSGLTHPALEQPFVQQPLDMRGLSGVFPSEQLDPGEAAIQDFRQTSREVEGTIERDPISKAEKAKMAMGIELAVDPLRQFALYTDDIPIKLLDYVEMLGEVLLNDLGKQLIKARAAHCVAQILAAAPPAGIKGADLLSQIRYGVKESKALGASPSAIALSPDDAESLDLATTGTDKVLIFPTRAVGTASPVWGLTVLEVPDLAAPIIMDAPILAKLFNGSAVLRVDMATGLSTNVCRILLEFESLLNVRSPLGAWVLAAPEGE
ncbi:MAG TPA: hypothetical protein VII01_13435 [Solirubrobacteraceae bacterium]